MTTTYKPTIKLYQADGTTLDESYFAGGILPVYEGGPELTWSVYGGCVSGKLKLYFPDAIREPFRLVRGQVVKIYQFTEDSDPIWTGTVDEVTRTFGGDAHEVTLRGLWDLVDIEITDAFEVGSQAAGTITVGGVSHDCNEYDTVKKIVQLLLDKFVVPGSSLITYTASDIVSDTPRALLKVAEGTSIKRLLAELALAAESVNMVDGAPVEDPARWSYGVDGTGAFWFKAIPSAVQNTVAFGVSIIGGGAEKSATTTTVVPRVITRGTIRRGTTTGRGVKTKRTYQYGTQVGGRRRGKVIRVASRYERDMACVAAGWLVRYAVAAPSISGVARVDAPAVALPMPWSGKIRWSDGLRLSIDSYASGLSATLGAELSWSVDLGIAAESEAIDGGDDPYAPSALDEALEGSDAETSADEIYQEDECSEGITGDTDYLGVDPSLDEPAYVTAEEAVLIPDLITDVATLQSDLDTAEGEIDTLQSDVDAAEQDIADLDGRVTDLEGSGTGTKIYCIGYVETA